MVWIANYFLIIFSAVIPRSVRFLDRQLFLHYFYLQGKKAADIFLGEAFDVADTQIFEFKLANLHAFEAMDVAIAGVDHAADFTFPALFQVDFQGLAAISAGQFEDFFRP